MKHRAFQTAETSQRRNIGKGSSALAILRPPRPRLGSPKSQRTSSHKFLRISESPKISNRNQTLWLVVKRRT
jgi:hypothetical protein